MPSSEGPSKEKLLRSISPEMRLTKDFFKSVYAYEISFPGFAEQAIAALEAAGCSHARQYYTDWVTDYETEYNAMMKRVAEWYSKQDFYNREVRKPRTRRQDIQNLTRNELTELCRRLLQEGIIETPEQFVTLVQQDR